MNQHSLSSKEIKEVGKVLVNIAKRNKITKLADFQDKLLSLGFAKRYTHFENLKYVLNEVGIDKHEGIYTFVKLSQLHSETKECWRCLDNKPLGAFKKCYRYIKKELNICNTCIKEESNITGESVPELNAIYEYLQFRYANVLDKSMYSRFWERALYGKSSSVSGYKSISS
jgi:hypothetical protein|tara:strand:+ start:190 stop:702 length:513 start_codon:yes stop_codon:yes gene_type:complete